jgi:hypothetical protein
LKSENRAPHLDFRAVAGLAVVLMFVAWWVSTPWRMIWIARRTAISNQAEIMREAEMMLAEAAATSEGVAVYGVSRALPHERPMPEHFAQLGGFRASVSPRYPGAVKVSVTGGHTHFGLYIIPNATTATKTMIREDKALKVINKHILQFDEG